VGASSCNGVQARIDCGPISTIPAFNSDGHSQPEAGGRGNTEAAGQRSSKNCGSMPRPVCQQDLPGPQEGRLLQTRSQPEAIESVHGYLALQNGEPGHAEGPTETRRLDGFSRPERCIPVSGNLGGASEIPAVFLEQQAVRVPMPPLRIMQCTKGFHEAAETCASTTSPPEHQAGYVPGRYAGDGRRERRPGEANPTDHNAPGSLGVYSEPREITADPITDHSVLGFPDRCHRDENQADRGEGGTVGNAMQGGSSEALPLSTRTSPDNREDDSCSPGGSPGSIVVSRIATLEESGHPTTPGLRPTSISEPGGPDGIAMVGNQNDTGEWEERADTGTRPGYGDRRVLAGLGCRLQRNTNRWPMVPDGVGTPHKLPGAAGSHFGRKSVCQGPEGHTYPSKDGLPDCSVLHKPNGRNTFPEPEQTGNPTVAMVPGEEPVIVSRISSGGGKLYSRPGVQNKSAICGVAPQAGSIPADNDSTGGMPSRPVCLTTECPMRSLRELEARPQRHGYGCPTNTMDQVDGICLPSILPNWQVSQEGQGGESFTDTGGSSMEITAVVSSSAGTSSGLSPDPPRGPRAPDGPNQQPTPSNSSRAAVPSRLETIQRRDQTGNFWRNFQTIGSRVE